MRNISFDIVRTKPLGCFGILVFVASVSNIMSMLSVNKIGILIVCALSYFGVVFLSNKANSYQTRYLLVAALLTLIVSWIGLNVSCLFITSLICQRNLFVVSALPSFFFVVAWLGLNLEKLIVRK